MTFTQLLDFINRYRTAVVQQQYAFSCARKYGVRDSGLQDRDLLRLRVLDRLVEANLTTPLQTEIVLPEWMDALTLDSLISSIRKRLTHAQ